MTRYEAFVEKSWRKSGITQLLVARIRDDGRADIGFFLVDLWCLGVKDAFLHDDGSEALLRELLAERLPEEFRERFHPACAKKMIEGAIAYAEQLGFAPHRDYRKARRALTGLDASSCPETFAFGRDGKPCYVEGPNDTAERTERVLAILEARCGSGGYDYELANEENNAEDDDLLAMREDLMIWLDTEAPEVPRFYMLSGMIAALHVCPGLVIPTRLLGVLWGPEGRLWTDETEAQDFAALLMDYWNYAGDLMRSATAPEAPPGEQAIDVWPEDFPEDNPLPFAAATVEWARGFLRATELWPEAWDNALGRPDLAPHWEIVRWWAELSQPGNVDRIAGAAEATPSRTMMKSVTALARALRPAGPPPDDGPR